MISPTAHIFELPPKIPVYIGRQEYVVGYAAGKNVLHLGCVDEGLIEIKQQKGLWLHERIVRVANTVWGVDIDKKGIEQIRAEGFSNVFIADIENLAEIPEIFQQEFDLILLTEVLEHLDNPGKFLNNILPLFKSATEMLITVPNATSLANILENSRGRELVHPDHNYWFSYHTIQSLFSKYNFELNCVGVYCQHNYHRSLLRYLYGRLQRLFHIQSANAKHSVEEVDDKSAGSPYLPNIKGYLNALFTTLIYRAVISRRPLFADGLIFIARPRHQADLRKISD